MKCPPNIIDYFQCDCSDSGDGTIWLKNCGGDEKLGDAKTSELLQWFITNSDISPLRWLNLAYNQLTRIPKELSQLKHLKSVYFHHNAIRTLKANDLNFSQTIEEIYLTDNSLINIEPGAFNGETISDPTQSTQDFTAVFLI